MVVATIYQVFTVYQVLFVCCLTFTAALCRRWYSHYFAHGAQRGEGESPVREYMTGSGEKQRVRGLKAQR